MSLAQDTAASALVDLLFDEPGIGRCLVAPDETVVRVNSEWLRSTRFAAEQVLGESIVELFPESRDMALALHARARAGHRVQVPRHAQFVNGRETWWEGSIAPVPMEGGTGLLITAREIMAPAEDVSDRKRAEQALRDSEQRFRALTETMPQIVCAFTPDLALEYVNPAWIEYSGLDLVRSARAGWKGVLHPDDVAAARACWQRALEQRTPQEVELRYRARDGTFRWFLNRLAPIFDGERLVRFMGAGMDIDDRKRAEAERERLVQELRDADRRKDDFIGMLSHELRNPLAPIRNAAYILERSGLQTGQARQATSVIQRQAEHLTRLVDDLLDVTRIARGKIDLKRARVDLCELLRGAADDFRELMQRRGVAFETVVPPDAVFANADAMRLTQVIGNLLHNAAKFTRRGDIVTLTLRSVDGQAEIGVRDTGAGIDPAVLPLVFEPFVQGERTLARTEGGLGLGLALVKGIVELHDGSVRVESAGRGKGAEFVLRIPAAAPLASEPVDTAPARAPGKARRVLVVDDNRDGADSLAQVVQLFGHHADVAYDGPSAIAKVRADPPDVVLCDIGLPGMSGYEVAQAIRAYVSERIQLVAVSGYAQPEDLKAALDAGFDCHLAKPASAEDIERILA